MSLQEKIKEIQKENISQQEKMKKIQDLYRNLSNLNINDQELNCDHYERKCEILSPCCGNGLNVDFAMMKTIYVI